MMMKKITIGLVAHVDAGKTTLSEALLYQAGDIRKWGRVDTGDAFLDPEKLEKQRGITIFSHLAHLEKAGVQFNLIDTPGHIDFATQTEASLNVLDYVVLVVSANDGLTSYTKVLWDLFAKYQLPVFVFVNKTDLVADKTKLLQALQEELSENCLDFTDQDNFYENLATVDEKLLDEYLATGTITDNAISRLISHRLVTPVYFGSALKLQGTEELMAGLARFGRAIPDKDDFSGQVYKISHDPKGERLTWLKITGGEVRNRMELPNGEKINQIRIYNANKFTTSTEAGTGEIVALTGLQTTYPGQGFNHRDAPHASLIPTLRYRLKPQNMDVHTAWAKLSLLKDEEPQLHLTWSEALQEIQLEIMGPVQLEILQQELQERFDLQVSFDEGGVLYRETITRSIEAVGHFEPLRHYSEVHFLLEPGPRGSGVVFANECSLEILSNNWQQQIMTALASKEHLGVLAGYGLTDVKITLIGGRASNVHTVGGDFREATYRGVRQGLMELKLRNACQLLEPWYKFKLHLNQQLLGRAMTDIQKMHGEFSEPIITGDSVVLEGQAPVSEMRDYANEVRSYSHGEGQLEYSVAEYRPCHNEAEIIKQAAYNPVADLANTPNSVFCYHGAGHTVTWDQVPLAAQFPYQYPLD